MKFVEKTEEFLEDLSNVDSLVDRNKILPDQIFKKQFTKFLVITFSEITEEFFFEKISSFVKELNESRWSFAVLNPDPKNFFYHFKKYPFFEINLKDSYKDYFFVTRNEPEPNSDDAIIYSMEVAVLHSSLLNWAIYADRDFELGIVGFQNKEIMEKFISVYGVERVFTMEQAITELLAVIYSDNTVPEDIRNQLIDHYGASSI